MPQAYIASVAAWLLTYAIHSTLALGAVWAAVRLGWVRCPATREALWKAALVAGVLTSTGQVLGGRVLGTGANGNVELAVRDVSQVWVAVTSPDEMPSGRSFETAELAPINPEASIRPFSKGDLPELDARMRTEGGVAGIVLLDSEGLECRMAMREALANRDLERARSVCAGGWLERAWLPWAIVLLWGGGGFLATLRLGWNHRIMVRLLAGRRTLADGPAPRILNDLLAATNPISDVRLSVADGLESPAVLGRREIALPPGMDARLGESELGAVLAHEVAHLVRRDPLWTRFARAFTALFFFQPLNRVASREILEAAEFLCDDWAVVNTGEPVTLARSLARVAGDMTPGRPQPALAMARGGGSPLLRRVERILLPDARRVQSGRWLRTGLVLSLIALPAFVPAVEIQRRIHIRIKADRLGPGAPIERIDAKPATSGASGGDAGEVQVMRFIMKDDGSGESPIRSRSFEQIDPKSSG